MNKLEKIKQLIKELNNASYAYYNQVPIMPDYEWDKCMMSWKHLNMLQALY